MTESDRRNTRRGVLLGGAAAVAAGGLVVHGGGRAEAADGDPILAGRTNTATAATTLNHSANANGFRVNSTGTGASAHALVTTAINGYGIIASSTGYNAAKFISLTPAGIGVWAENGDAASSQGLGLYAIHKGTGTGATAATAVRALQGPNASTIINTVRGQQWPAAGEFAGANGVIGASAQTGGTGVVGYASAGVGVWAGTGEVGGNALVAAGNGHVAGDLAVDGTLFKMSGSFRIDHPLDPANKYLSHSFVESPDMMNVYNGVIEAGADGAAVVELPDWLETLNRDFRYQLTPLGAPAPDLHVSAEVSDNRFTIAGAKPGQRVSWQVTGIRQDAWAEDHRIPVEHDKPEADRGTYLYPEGVGLPADQSTSARLMTKAPTAT